MVSPRKKIMERERTLGKNSGKPIPRDGQKKRGQPVCTGGGHEGERSVRKSREGWHSRSDEWLK